MRFESDRPSPEFEPPRPAADGAGTGRTARPETVEAPPASGDREPGIELTITEQVPTELRRPARVDSPAAVTARLLLTRGDREFLDWQGAVLVTAETASAKEAAAREVFTRVASIVAQSVTLPNQRQALRDGLLVLVNNDFRPEPVTDVESAVRRKLVDWFMGVTTEILKSLAVDTILALLLPGGYLFVPPSSFVQAILTVCDLLNYVEAA